MLNYEVTSNNIGCTLDIELVGDQVLLQYNRNPVEYLGAREVGFLKTLRRACGHKIRLEGVNVQIACDGGTFPLSAQLTDFGQYNVRPHFAHAVTGSPSGTPLWSGLR